METHLEVLPCPTPTCGLDTEELHHFLISCVLVTGIREQLWSLRSHGFWLKAICPVPELPWGGMGRHQQPGRVHSASFYEVILKQIGQKRKVLVLIWAAELASSQLMNELISYN